MKRLTSEKFLHKANALWYDGEPNTALGFYIKADETLLPNDPITHHVEVKSAYALCLCELGDFSKAITIYPGLYQLCMDNGLEEAAVLRQWAKAQEQTGAFIAARRTYGMAAPNKQTRPIDRLKWNHAMGLLNWRDGRLTEARDNLSVATELMPKDQGEASALLAVLGNDALLSLELDDSARALRLADQMTEIRAATGEATLSNEINLIRVHAALEKLRGDHSRETAILRDGIALLEKRAPKDWNRRLDLVNDYVTASLSSTSNSDAIAYLSSLCVSAPDNTAWIGRFMLARLQIASGQDKAAKSNLTYVLASFVGSGSAASEVEIIIELAKLFQLKSNRATSILLGKLVLKYLSQIGSSFEGASLRNIVHAGNQITQQTVTHLRAEGRFEEAQTLEKLLERIQRHALFLRGGSAEADIPQPVPFDQEECRAEGRWLDARRALREMRDVGDLEGAKHAAMRMLNDLSEFESTSGMNRRPTDTAYPTGNMLRLSLVPSKDACVVYYRWARKLKSVQIAVSADEFFSLTANLREAVKDNSAWKMPATWFYRKLITPIQDDLAQIDGLEIDASGILGRIPFGLLSDGGQCLARQVPIKYVIDVSPPERAAPVRSGLLHCAAFRSGPLASYPAFMKRGSSSLKPVNFVSASAFTRDGFLEGLSEKPYFVSVATHLDSEPTRPEHWALCLGSDTPLYLMDLGGACFDLHGVRVALFAACSSSLHDASDVGRRSLAALALEKGVTSFVGTLWDITETAAARFVDEFWGALSVNTERDPAAIVAELQWRHAEQAHQIALVGTSSGGIGDRSLDTVPADWAAFAVFENSNGAQPTSNYVAEPSVMGNI